MNILACDIGGTRIKLGVVQGKRLLAQSDIPAEAGKGLVNGLERIGQASRPLCRKAGIKTKDLDGFGMAFPGIVEPGTERILSSPEGKFDDAKTLDVAKLAGKLIGLPSLVCNDANAALAGEWHFGAARTSSSVVMMTLGTGIGTSAIIDGVPLRGKHGQAGCLGGHITMNLDGRMCPCCNVGCAETEASTWALPALARSHPSFAKSSLTRKQTLDYAALFGEAARGDRLAIKIRDRSIHVWAGVLVGLIHAYDPECAVIGGGIMDSGAVILPRLRRYVIRHAWTAWGKVKIKPAALRNNAGMLGVAALFEGRK